MKTSKKDSKKLFVVSVAMRDGSIKRLKISAQNEYERNEKALQIRDALFYYEL